MAALDIRREALSSPAAMALTAALNAELSAAYPEPGATHFSLAADEVAEGHGAFMIAVRGGTPLGCGAVRLLNPTTAEIKRMYVAPVARGQGVGRAVLDALEKEARRLGATRVVLETGVRQLAALALYRTAGFNEIPPYGEYRGSTTTSVCFSKALGADDTRLVQGIS
jgi:putative acetyltransferase